MLWLGVRAVKGERVSTLLSSRTGFVALLAVISVYYLFLLSNGTFALFAPELLSRVFDNMLVHLLHGEFNVDRSAIDYEGVTRNGKTYTYFGIIPALLRLVATPFTDVARVQFARLSCLTAVVIFVALQLWTLLIVHDRLPAASRVPGFLAVMLAATSLGGPQIYILGSAWIYHEPILWSAAMGAAFNLIVVRAAFGAGGLGTGELVSLAMLAGLALNTRAPIGVALYLGTFFLVAWTAWRRHASGRLLTARRGPLAAIAAPAYDPRILLPITVLGVLAVAAGIVNFERWGSPLAFTDTHQYTYWMMRHPDLVVMVRDYGAINLNRIWIGVLYYATGIPYVLKTVPPFTELFRYSSIEAPPIIPLLTNPLTVLLAGIGLYRLWWKPELRPGGLAILRLALTGHTFAVVLIFAYFTLTLRYRFDLAPFMTLAAFVGYRAVSITAAQSSEIWRKRARYAAVGLCVLGILFSHYVLLIHKVWSIGEPMEVRRALSVFAPFAFKP
jgi:hypothetical protein